MPIDVAAALRIKGMAEAALAAAPANAAAAATGLVETYIRVRGVCAELVANTEAQDEFERLFPTIAPLPDMGHPRRNVAVERAAIAGDRARVLLAALAGWLASWPSAEQLLDELIAALEEAEAEATEPTDKERLAGLLEGLKGAGRQIAVGVVTAYLTRVHV